MGLSSTGTLQATLMAISTLMEDHTRSGCLLQIQARVWASRLHTRRAVETRMVHCLATVVLPCQVISCSMWTASGTRASGTWRSIQRIVGFPKVIILGDSEHALMAVDDDDIRTTTNHTSKQQREQQRGQSNPIKLWRAPCV